MKSCTTAENSTVRSKDTYTAWYVFDRGHFKLLDLESESSVVDFQAPTQSSNEGGDWAAALFLSLSCVIVC